VFIDGKRVEIINPRHAVEMGIGLVPEDRKTQGLVLSLPVRKNISLPSLDQFIRRGLVDEKQEVRVIKKYMDQLDIRTSSIDQEVQYLSGGNQQKVVLAKWLTTDPKIIILDEPTRGIDVGTKFEMYRIIRNLADQGTGIVMISSELPEIIGMSDRVLVMRDRTIAGELERTEATEEKILRLAIGE
jgi:ABC-type sugar transport system ATPase subunit